jgi:hypothetical protein
MSAGTRVYALRIDGGMMEDAEETISRRNEFTRREPWNFSDFLRAAIREKIAKMQRSRRNRSKAPKPIFLAGVLSTH